MPHPLLIVKSARSSPRSQIVKEAKGLATKEDGGGQAGDVLIVAVVDIGLNSVLAL